MKSVMQHSFSQVPSVQMERSSFDRSHGHKTTFFADKLVPIFVDEVLPGDTFNLNDTIFARLATPIAPIMDNLFLDTFFFFVPNRLLWKDWEHFMGAKDNPGDSTQYAVPVIKGTWVTDGMADHFGIPDPVSHTILAGDKINALPFRAANRIYNEWFRDENLINSAVVGTSGDPLGAGPDDFADYPLRKRAKKRDYFTSALPWPQKGTAVPLPLGTSAPVKGTGMALGLYEGTNHFGLAAHDTQHVANTASGAYGLNLGSSTISADIVFDKAIGVTPVAQYSGLMADLSTATAATINSLRQAIQLQRLLERDARGGTRYTEILKAHFRCTSPDYRLQRSEYLGGSSSRINISPVQQNAPKATADSGQTPLGTMGGYGVHAGRSGFNKSFTEHGYIIGFVNVRADITYQQGLNRMWSRQTKYDFYWPALAHIGEQEVFQKEIFLKGSSNADDNIIFGYQERYAEYRYYPSLITGEFRSTFATPLDSWHLSEKFATAPGLNQTFMESNTPMKRVLAVPGTDENPYPHFIMDQFFDLKCARPMPVYSVPGLIDHF